MAARYNVDNGGAVAFRNSPDMSDKSEQIAKAGSPIVCQGRSGSGADEWVQHTNGLWLPLRFLVPVAAVSSAPPPPEEAARNALFAGAKPKSATRPKEAARSALFAGATPSGGGATAAPAQPAPAPPAAEEPVFAKRRYNANGQRITEEEWQAEEDRQNGAQPPAEKRAEAAAAGAAEAAKVSQQARLERLPSAPEAAPEAVGLRCEVCIKNDELCIKMMNNSQAEPGHEQPGRRATRRAASQIPAAGRQGRRLPPPHRSHQGGARHRPRRQRQAPHVR